MDANRHHWNEQQQALRKALSRPAEHSRAMKLLLEQHAAVHSAQMSGGTGWSMEDEVWEGLSESAARCIPAGMEHSIAWVFWHLTRIEDVTMNLLLAGSPQVFSQEDWQARLKSPFCETGNAMDAQGIVALSAALDLEALRAYRLAVGRRTRGVVQQLEPGEMLQKIDPTRLQRVMDEGAVLEASRGLLDYWGGLSKAGLLLMPPTRHPVVHLNEAMRLKQKAR